jgi:NADH-quinone oxidoreductase subunit E
MDARVRQIITEEFREAIAKCPHPRELLVHLLRAVQRENGWVPDQGVALAADLLGIPAIEIEELATFYDKIYRRPVGRRVIHLCDSICCFTRESDEIRRHLTRRLGIEMGQTTPDGVFTLLPTCCLGACGQAPAMQVGMTLYGDLTPEKVDRILEQERQGGKP